MNNLFFAFILIALFSCVENNTKTPDGALKDFVQSRMGQIVTREFVLSRLTGKMLVSFQNMSDEDFNKFADLRNITSENFKILTKSCQEKKCFITYSITYSTKKDSAKIFSTEVKKIAELNLIEGQWLIADVSNIKTYHEAMEPINPLQE
jgi:hypothetical protein